MKMPATTIVAAWISADTGVGPAMASGSHVCSTNWPDFDITAAVSQQRGDQQHEVVDAAVVGHRVDLEDVEAVRPPKNNVIIPTSRPTSPTRLVMNALRAASEFGFSSHQCPMSTNEQRPTSSQPVIICIVLRLMTSSSIDAVNSDRNAK